MFVIWKTFEKCFRLIAFVSVWEIRCGIIIEALGCLWITTWYAKYNNFAILLMQILRRSPFSRKHNASFVVVCNAIETSQTYIKYRFAICKHMDAILMDASHCRVHLDSWLFYAFLQYIFYAFLPLQSTCFVTLSSHFILDIFFLY